MAFSQKTSTPSVDTFSHAIKKCRSRETSGAPEERSEKNPSRGQCLATALLANEVLWLSVYAEKLTLASRTLYHYFNKNENDEDYRFCAEQLTHFEILERQKERLLGKDQLNVLLEQNPGIQQRYALLKKTFQTEILQNLEFRT